MAFPTTGTLEDGSGADEDPISTNWDEVHSAFIAGDTGKLAKLSHQLTNQTGGGTDTSSGYDATSFSGDVEVWATIVTASSVTTDQFKLVMMNDLGTSTADGYELHVEKSAGSDIWKIRRRDNVTPVVLGADPLANQELASGDSVGLELISGTLTAYYKASGGSWTSLGSRADSTYTGPWYLGIKTVQASSGAWQTVPFGGGTVVTGPAPTLRTTASALRW